MQAKRLGTQLWENDKDDAGNGAPATLSSLQRDEIASRKSLEDGYFKPDRHV